MRELKELKLPKRVEERRKEEESILRNSPTTSPTESALDRSFSSASMESPSPTTSIFSSRGHIRYPSSNSSLTSSPVAFDSMDGFEKSKRPLTEVMEEPHEREGVCERDEIWDNISDCQCNEIPQMERPESLDFSSALSSPACYDLADYPYGDGDFVSISRPKRQRAGETPVNALATRIGTRFPSFSRKWRSRATGTGSTISIGASLQEPARSRANSTRAPSVSGSVSESIVTEPFLPPTPRTSRSDHDDEENEFETSIDTEKANSALSPSDEYTETLASTPLLPPLMVDFPSHVNVEPVQSPLQSPAIAECESFPVLNSPNETPQHSGLPSPPLSTKPSISSFRQHRPGGHLVPCSDIPPIMIADPSDEWANRLGHANFNIHPEPYLPPDVGCAFDLEACKQLRANWDLARCNYMKHLVRIGEHYGVTSKIYMLTEEKWAAVDAQWMANDELTIARTNEANQHIISSTDRSEDEAPPIGLGLGLTLTSQAPPTPELHTPLPPPPLMKLPSLNGPSSEGKFPKLEDEDIVGPMEQVAAQMQRRPSRKRTFLRFLQSIVPMGRRGSTG